MTGRGRRNSCGRRDSRSRPSSTPQEDGAFLGYVIFHRYGGEDAAELGWVLRRSAWGRGYAGRLTALLLSAAEGKWAEAVIECAPEQRASVRVAEKLGFREEGMADGCRIFRRTVNRDNG